MSNQIHKVTVGFPVYNVEAYVYRSLKSVLDQTLDDIEVIVVDDCGSDHSMDVIHDLIASHPNGNIVRIIKHKKNAGLAEARNTAIKNAQSKYIYFLDSDDYISTDALSILYNNAEKYQTDVVFSSNYKQEGDRIWVEDKDILPSIQFLNKGEFSSYLYNTLKDIMPNTVWNILFRMDFLHNNNLLFPNIRFQEDIAFNELYHPCIERAAFIPNKTYYYTMRSDSLMNKTARDSIGIHEAERAIALCKLIKSWCPRWSDKPYYGGKCAKILRKCFFEASGVLKHRKIFAGDISNRDIRDMVKHPDSLIHILKYKQFKIYNLFFYLIGILPPVISVYILQFTCKKKGFF